MYNSRAIQYQANALFMSQEKQPHFSSEMVQYHQAKDLRAAISAQKAAAQRSSLASPQKESAAHRKHTSYGV